MQNVQRVSARERFHRVKYLLKNTFTVVGRHRGILSPAIRTVVYGAIANLPLFVGIGLAIHGGFTDSEGLFTAGLIAIGLWVPLFLYEFFYFTRQEAMQAWLVGETVAGRNRTLDEAATETKAIAGQIRKIALLDMFVSWLMSITSRKRSKGGFASFLLSLLMRGIAEVWDLVNHYLLPAVTLDRLSIRDGVAKIKELKDHVPKTLVGVFGIDFIGRIVGILVAPIYALIALLAFAMSVWLAGILPSVEFVSASDAGDVPSWMLTDGALELTLIPLVGLLFVAKLGSIVLDRAVTTVKVSYFTIFYTQIERPEHIAEELRGELLAYLKMEELPGGGGAAQQISESAPAVGAAAGGAPDGGDGGAGGGVPGGAAPAPAGAGGGMPVAMAGAAAAMAGQVPGQAAPGGQAQPGHPQAGHPQPGYPPGGQAQPGHPQAGHPQPGYPPGGQAQPGHPHGGQGQPGYPQGGQAQPGHPQAGHPQPGYPPGGQAQPGYPQAGHPQPGHPQPGHPQPGHPPQASHPGDVPGAGPQGENPPPAQDAEPAPAAAPGPPDKSLAKTQFQWGPPPDKPGDKPGGSGQGGS